MRIKWFVAAAVAAIALTVMVLATRERAHPQATTANSGSKTSSSSKPVPLPAGVPAESPRETPVAHEAATRRDFERELRDADDRWDFAASVLDEAKGGNGAAQFYLSLALSDCKAFDNMFFRDGNRLRTYDEAMQAVVKRGGVHWEYVSDVYTRCKRLLESGEAPFGTADEWMHAAIDSGYPLAQAYAARDVAIKARYEPDPDKAQAQREEARRLALEALRTKDPAAIMAVGDVASWLDSRNGADNPHQWVWLLAACQRGLDCSRQSSSYQFRCAGFDPQCQPGENGMVDVVRRESGSRFPDLERRAQELNAKIDQDQFDDLF